MVVFLAALKWLDFDFLKREEYVVDILGCVRFSQMSMKEVLACYHPPILMGIMLTPAVYDMLHGALQ